MPLTLVTAPDDEPLTLAEAKNHLKVDLAADDALIQTLISAVRERCEAATGRALISQTYDWKLDRFPPCSFLEFPKPPLQSVTSVTYIDSAGDSQTWASTKYDVQALSGDRAQAGRLALSYGISWPSTYGEIGDVTIRFVAGYGAATAVPSLLKAGMLLDLGTLYSQRSGVIVGTISGQLPMGVKDIYWSFRAHPQTVAA